VTPSQESRRLDKWLLCARRFKTRSLAARFIMRSSVRITRNGATIRVDQPSFHLREGDVVSFVDGDKFRAFRVAGFAERRGPPASASRLCQIEANCKDPAAITASPACKPP
jgi:ribosome-associated heat shock protein Hsp15